MLEDTVLNCISECIACHLENAPAAEDVPTIRDVYCENLKRHGLRSEDSSRVSQAFGLWVKHESRFPTPADIIKNLPKKIHQPIPADKHITHSQDEGRSDALAREHIGKWRAIRAGEWKTGQLWTQELADKFCTEISDVTIELDRAIGGLSG